MKFIHIADLHLDQSFEGLGKLPQPLSDRLLTKNQEALSELVEKALEEEVDFVLIVGDTFHQPRVTVKTQNFFIQQMERLAQKDIIVVLCFGNHDYFEEHRFWFEFPKNVVVFETEEVGTVVISTRERKQVAISGFSYNSRWLTGSKLNEYPMRRKDVDYHIGLYHGQIGEKKYGDFSPEIANSKGYDYWALGHIHQPQILMEKPLMIYPGSLIPHTKKENASGQYIMLSYQGNDAIKTWGKVGSIFWESKEIDTKQVETIQELLECCQQLIDEERTGTCFVDLSLSNLGETIKQIGEDVVQKKELLNVIQKMIYQESNGSVWVYNLELSEQVAMEKYTLPLRQEVVNNLFASYQSLDKFQETVGDLYKQATSAQLVNLSREQTDKVVKKAKEVFTQSFSTKGREDK